MTPQAAMTCRRRPDWPARLANALETARTRPFRWGEHDCCLFACDLVQAMTGFDPAWRLRGRYGTALEALYLLIRRYGGGLDRAVPMIAREVGFVEVRPERAGRGDLVLLPLPSHGFGHALTLRHGPGVLALTEGQGLTALPLAPGARAWRI